MVDKMPDPAPIEEVDEAEAEYRRKHPDFDVDVPERDVDVRDSDG